MSTTTIRPRASRRGISPKGTMAPQRPCLPKTRGPCRTMGRATRTTTTLSLRNRVGKSHLGGKTKKPSTLRGPKCMTPVARRTTTTTTKLGWRSGKHPMITQSLKRASRSKCRQRFLQCLGFSARFAHAKRKRKCRVLGAKKLPKDRLLHGQPPSIRPQDTTTSTTTKRGSVCGTSPATTMEKRWSNQEKMMKTRKQKEAKRKTENCRNGLKSTIPRARHTTITIIIRASACGKSQMGTKSQTIPS